VRAQNIEPPAIVVIGEIVRIREKLLGSLSSAEKTST
jgi:siroheme synthase